MNRRLAIAAAPLILLAACSSGGGSSEPSTVTQTVTSSSSASSSSEATASSSSSSASPLRVGETYTSATSKVTLLEVKQNAGKDETGIISSDQHYAAIKVKTCIKDAGYVSFLRWNFVDSDGGEFEPLDVTPPPSEWPHPVFPHDGEEAPKRPAGSCVTGWIVTGVNQDTKITAIHYRADGSTGVWKL